MGGCEIIHVQYFPVFLCLLSRLELNESTGKANAATNTRSAQLHTAARGGSNLEGESWLRHEVVLRWKSRSLPRDVKNRDFINPEQAERKQLKDFCSWDFSHRKLVFLLQTLNLATKLGQGNSLGVSLRTESQSWNLWPFSLSLRPPQH